MLSEVERYIYNLLDQVHKKDDLDQIFYDLSILADFFSYKTVNESFGDDFETRKQTVLTKVNNIQSDILKSFFVALIGDNNLFLFEPGHFKSFMVDFESIAKKIVFMSLTTSIELTPEDLHILSETLSKRMKCWVKVDQTVDETIIGGVIIKNDNYILDYSLKARLTNFASEWKKTLQVAKENNV